MVDSVGFERIFQSKIKTYENLMKNVDFKKYEKIKFSI